MQNESIIQTHLKFHFAITNAKLFLEVAKKHESFGAFMQAVGMVNDHLFDCFVHLEMESKMPKRKSNRSRSIG